MAPRAEYRCACGVQLSAAHARTKDDLAEGQARVDRQRFRFTTQPCEYLSQALALIESLALRAERIDWSELRATEVAGFARARTETYPVIRSALRELADGHSFFLEPGQRRAREMNAKLQSSDLFGRRHCRADRIGPGFLVHRKTGPEAADFAEKIQGLIALNDCIDMRGWIVDLRDNRGGNMWPMIAGLGPILGEGVLGAFVGPGECVTNGSTVTAPPDATASPIRLFVARPTGCSHRTRRSRC
jgi:peptidase S41-like protein